MIPTGWALVPVVPSERMLDEFSEVAWPDKHELGPIWREKRALEAKAYAAMLKVVPTAPEGHADEVEALRRQIAKLETVIHLKNESIKKMNAKLYAARNSNPA